MEKVIVIDLMDKYDLVEKYNENITSRELLKYIINQALLLDKSERFKVIINNKIKIGIDCVEMIKLGLKEEYERSMKEHNHNNIKQFIFFLLGTTFIFLSSLIKEETIWKEILLISGWVPIWEMIEVELFSDAEGRRKRNAIKRLLDVEMVEG